MIPAPTALSEALRTRYLIERELGRGGMARVYLAQDVKHGRRVAIKVLAPCSIPDQPPACSTT